MQAYSKYSTNLDAHDKRLAQYIHNKINSATAWFASEMIHGTNIAIYIERLDEGEGELSIRFSSRGMMLEEDQESNLNFYSLDSIREVLENKAIAMFNILSQPLIIYGTMCGNYYPDIKCEHKKLSSKVFYSPRTEFFVQDVKTLGEYLDYQTVRIFSKKAKFLNPPTRQIGSLEQCLATDTGALSTVYELLGLDYPRSAHEGLNTQAGVIIKPNRVHYHPNGARIVLESKSDAFIAKQQASKDKNKKRKADAVVRLAQEAEKRAIKNAKRAAKKAKKASASASASASLTGAVAAKKIATKTTPTVKITIKKTRKVRKLES